jgi:glutamate-1-semialdehyde 2,1-aminomutase
LRAMERINGWKLLEECGSLMEDCIRPVIQGKPLTFQRIGSMFCLYFCQGPVRNLADAKKSDTAAFARYFHGLLEKGIYVAPSQFEAGFLSTAHTEITLQATSRAIAELLSAF